jgi:hypothetical protein
VIIRPVLEQNQGEQTELSECGHSKNQFKYSHYLRSLCERVKWENVYRHWPYVLMLNIMSAGLGLGQAAIHGIRYTFIR